MNLSLDQIKAIAEWHKLYLAHGIYELFKVQKILGLMHGCIAGDDYELDGHFAFPVDPKDFDPDYIEENLSPDRHGELINGQKPSDEEVELWRKRKELSVFEEDGCWFHFYLWRVDMPNGKVYFRSLHGDQGILDCFDGPFVSEKEALAEAANLQINSRN